MPEPIDQINPRAKTMPQIYSTSSACSVNRQSADRHPVLNRPVAFWLVTGLFALFTLLFLVTPKSHAADIKSALIEENDFQQLSQHMKQKSLGLVLLLHAEHCHYCAQMENEILSPMVKSGDYDDRVLLRKLQIDEARDITNFSGETVEPSDLASRYNAFVTPTLVFLDSEGNEKAKQMVGINTVELFAAYLNNEIETLVNSIRHSPVKETALPN